MYTIYAIKSLTRNYIYVGMTSDLTKRLDRHYNGFEKTSKPYRPFELIYSEIVDTRIEARKREKYFKSGVGKDFLRNLVNNNY